MRFSEWIWALVLTAPLVAAERITVSVCSLPRLNDKLVPGAQATAAALFRPLDIEITWENCEIGLEGQAAIELHWFTLRFRAGRPFVTADSATMDMLGGTFFSDSGGYLADIYYDVVQALAAAREVELTPLLGHVMAHELGHLLMGPGHTPSGVMRPGWDRKDLDAINEGRLRFSSADGLRMRRALQGMRRSPT